MTELFKYQTYNSFTGCCAEQRMGTATQYNTAAIHCTHFSNFICHINIMPHIYR